MIHAPRSTVCSRRGCLVLMKLWSQSTNVAGFVHSCPFCGIVSVAQCTYANDADIRGLLIMWFEHDYDAAHIPHYLHGELS